MKLNPQINLWDWAQWYWWHSWWKTEQMVRAHCGWNESRAHDARRYLPKFEAYLQTSQKAKGRAKVRTKNSIS